MYVNFNKNWKGNFCEKRSSDHMRHSWDFLEEYAKADDTQGINLCPEIPTCCSRKCHADPMGFTMHSNEL